MFAEDIEIRVESVRFIHNLYASFVAHFMESFNCIWIEVNSRSSSVAVTVYLLYP